MSKKRAWRVVIDGRLPGVANMARDRAILEAVERGESSPTLRLYRWVRPTVTLGRFQSAASVDLAAAHRYGVDVVRRVTGGRGVLHDDELTYAVIAGVRDGVPRGVAASYRHLCEALVEAYRLIGVPVDMIGHDRPAAPSAACYLATTRADLAIGARKVSGSAQVWIGSTVLQHGSFVVSRDAAREARIFRLDAEDESRLESGTASIVATTGVRPDFDELERCVIEGFARSLDVEFVAAELSLSELSTASLLEDQMNIEPGARLNEDDSRP